jgi:hypothetical protein
LAVDLVSIPLYTSWCVCSIYLDMYKLPWLWVDTLISVIPCYRYVTVTLIALFPHPFSLISRGFTLMVGSLTQTLGRFIALLLSEVP